MHDLIKKVSEHLKNPPVSKSDLERKLIICPSKGWIKPTLDELEDSSKQIIAFADNEGGGKLLGLDILSFGDVMQKHRNAVIVVALWDDNERKDVINQLLQVGFPRVTDAYAYTYSKACYGNIRRQKELYYLEKAWDFFEDESDREVILNKALYYLGAIGETPYELPQYFIPFMDISEDEVFADCGFFNGDTAESYINDASGKFKKYYAFEPNAKNIAMVKPEIKNDPRIEITQAGVYSHCTTLMFNDEYADASSFEMKGAGNVEVPVVSLDAFFADKEKPTFIKMDIEGSEMAAILGAKYLIRDCKPKLAICLYHKPEDMIEIPKLIREILPEYKFILKQHRGLNTETVLYCKV
jgi:FkbM family methyltransferase